MKTATCTTCGAVVEWPAKICPHCGATIKSFKNMVGCRVCDNPVAKNANKCPHCGAHTPNKNNFIAGILAIVFVGVWFIVTILSLGPSDTSDDTKQAAATPKEKRHRPCSMKRPQSSRTAIICPPLSCATRSPLNTPTLTPRPVCPNGWQISSRNFPSIPPRT